ncbi:unnamed protein product [Closterium sp. Naga37s-1]|nr:unnamed protein product [Closterium sp. Naga37s-1]
MCMRDKVLYGAGAAGAALEGVKVLISVFFLGAYSFTAPSTTPQEHTMHMTGQMAREQRAQHWRERRVFFVTGQVLLQDMVQWGACPREAIVCLVVDEAHRATGNYAYARVVEEPPLLFTSLFAGLVPPLAPPLPAPASPAAALPHGSSTKPVLRFDPAAQGTGGGEQAGHISHAAQLHCAPLLPSSLSSLPSPFSVPPAQLPKVQEVVEKLGISLMDRCPAMLCRQLYQLPLALPSTSSMPPAQLPKVQEVVDKLGLSPIAQLPKVQEVVDKLGISLIEYRGDDDPQVAQYMHKRTEQVVKVRMHTAVAEVEKLLLAEQRRCLEALNRLGLVSSALVSSSKDQRESSCLNQLKSFLSTPLAPVPCHTMPSQMMVSSHQLRMIQEQREISRQQEAAARGFGTAPMGGREAAGQMWWSRAEAVGAALERLMSHGMRSALHVIERSRPLAAVVREQNMHKALTIMRRTVGGGEGGKVSKGRQGGAMSSASTSAARVGPSSAAAAAISPKLVELEKLLLLHFREAQQRSTGGTRPSSCPPFETVCCLLSDPLLAPASSRPSHPHFSPVSSPSTHAAQQRSTGHHLVHLFKIVPYYLRTRRAPSSAAQNRPKGSARAKGRPRIGARGGGRGGRGEGRGGMGGGMGGRMGEKGSGRGIGGGAALDGLNGSRGVRRGGQGNADGGVVKGVCGEEDGEEGWDAEGEVLGEGSGQEEQEKAEVEGDEGEEEAGEEEEGGDMEVRKRLMGQSQKQQQAVLDGFKAGTYNVLVSTTIGEEGLDISQVDLVVCFDAVSVLRMTQRMGRTGRSRDGKVDILLTTAPHCSPPLLAFPSHFPPFLALHPLPQAHAWFP